MLAISWIRLNNATFKLGHGSPNLMALKKRSMGSDVECCKRFDLSLLDTYVESRVMTSSHTSIMLECKDVVLKLGDAILTSFQV